LRSRAAQARHDRLICQSAPSAGGLRAGTLLRSSEGLSPRPWSSFHMSMNSRRRQGRVAELGTALPVAVAVEGDRPTVGEVLLAGTGDDLTLKTADSRRLHRRPVRLRVPSSVMCFFKALPAVAAMSVGGAADPAWDATARFGPESAARIAVITRSRRTGPRARSTACRRRPR